MGYLFRISSEKAKSLSKSWNFHKQNRKNHCGKQDFKAYDLNISIGLAGAESVSNMDEVDLLIGEAEKDMKKIRKVAKRFSRMSKSSLYSGNYYEEE